nr:formin-like protein 5 [Aegilops tauschii subsp. strangulata]
MAPHKVKTASSSAWYEPALDAPNVSEKNLAAMRLLTAGEGNKRGKTELRVASDVPKPEGSTIFPFFTSNIVAGPTPVAKKRKEGVVVPSGTNPPAPSESPSMEKGSIGAHVSPARSSSRAALSHAVATSEKEKQAAAEAAATREAALKDAEAAKSCCQALEAELKTLRSERAEGAHGHQAEEEKMKALEDAVKGRDTELEESTKVQAIERGQLEELERKVKAEVAELAAKPKVLAEDRAAFALLEKRSREALKSLYEKGLERLLTTDEDGPAQLLPYLVAALEEVVSGIGPMAEEEARILSSAALTRVFSHLHLRDPTARLDELLEPVADEHYTAAAAAVKGGGDATKEGVPLAGDGGVQGSGDRGCSTPPPPGTPAGATLPPAVIGAATSSSSLILIPPPRDANAPPPLDIGVVGVRRTTAARRPRRLDLFPVVDPATVADPSPSSSPPDHIEPHRHLCSPTPVRAMPSSSPLYPVCHDLVRRSLLPPDPRAGRRRCSVRCCCGPRAACAPPPPLPRHRAASPRSAREAAALRPVRPAHHLRFDRRLASPPSLHHALHAPPPHPPTRASPTGASCRRIPSSSRAPAAATATGAKPRARPSHAAPQRLHGRQP